MNKIGRNIYDIQNSRAINIDKKKRPAYKIYGDESKNTVYERTAIRSDYCDSILNQTFFSQKNVKIVQNGLRHNVWKKSEKKHVIGEQSETELIVVMRSIFLQYSKNLPDNIPGQIKELNKKVIDDLTPKILSNVEQYIGYLENKKKIPEPIAHSVNVSSKGSKTLRSVTTTF